MNREIGLEKLEGYIERIVFRNAENGYTVFSLAVKNAEEDDMTVVGSFPFISEGEYVSLEGSYTDHAIYGRQFNAQTMAAATPKDSEAMEKYLSSGTIKGIGETLAKRIVKKFGDKTFEIIEREPERLAEVKGISDNGAREIYKQFKEKSEARETMLYLQQFGISTLMAVKIFNTYGNRTREILAENPYKPAEDIKGIGFQFSDELAKRMGFGADSDYRLRAGIIYTMNQGMNAGHSYLPEEVLYRHASETLEVGSENFGNIVDELVIGRKLALKLGPGEIPERRIYLSGNYYCELGIARQLHDLNRKFDISDAEAEMKTISAEKRLSVSLEEKQRQALTAALQNALSIITGGPGTGKTTTIRALIEIFVSEGQNVLLAAPTGRAAKRMTEATGEEARTIHRLLEFQPVSGEIDGDMRMAFARNEENPLDADVIIIDEASMIDMHMMNSLLRAVTIGTRLIFSGDSRQLPSVGAGNVLDDMIKSGCFNVVRLDRIFRQAEESDIIVNAHKIDHGEHPVLENKNSKDFFMLKRTDAKSVIDTMISMVSVRLPKYVQANPFDIQVLTPMKSGELGVENLNRVLQNALNPAGPGKMEKEFGSNLFREGDKVMQIKNDYQLEWRQLNRYGIQIDGGLGVFNGDMGIIKEINHFAELVTVLFDEDREVEYAFSALDELKLAYAVTVHKSQGSEYPAVVLPLLGCPRHLMNRNLLYTAVTRAVKCVEIIGSEEVFMHMIDNDEENKRFTGLKDEIVAMKDSYN